MRILVLNFSALNVILHILLFLQQEGHTVNRKRVQRLMRILGLVAMVPSPNTSKKHPQDKVFPYLLLGMDIIRPNQV
ncbi:IS3 family transposase [Deefgea sp. CFH1-16]|nr:IS3 family transposase [Deefgea sp. CFH1-16]